MKGMILEWTAALWIGAALDGMIGDPQGWWHPVRSIGWLIERSERWLRKLAPRTAAGELAAGTVLAVWVPAATVFCAWAALEAAQRIHPLLGFALMCVMCGQLLAARSLCTESMKVCRALKAGELEEARKAVSMIVGRDTCRLTREGITRAAVETVAENTSDGVTAPLLWMLLFGPLGGFFYKAVNTMDSMVGYENDRYFYFGRAAAWLDDWVNWIPARLTALFFVAAAWLLPGYDGAGAFRIWRRDRRRHKSPNSAQGESACAGALGIQLAGDAWYFGVLHKKPWIGDPVRPICPEDIGRACMLMKAVFFMMLAAGTGGMVWIGEHMGEIVTVIPFLWIFP